MIDDHAPVAFVGVDIGGTTIKTLAVDRDGHVIARHVRPTFGESADALQSLHDALEALLDETRDSGYRPKAIGACTPGTVEPDLGVVAFAGNLGWQNVPLAEAISTRHRLPVRVDHDARAAASAELRGRGGPSSRHVLFVPLGTGVSAAVTLDGRAIVGSTGAAGELGHVIVRPGGELCICGQRGCVEAYAGAASILRRYQARGGTATSVERIAQNVARETLAATIWDDAIDALARGLQNAVSLIDPDIIVLGGGLSQAGDALVDPLKARLQNLLTWRPVPEVTLSILGSFGGIVGAALLAARDFTSTEVQTLVRELARTPLRSPAPQHTSKETTL